MKKFLYSEILDKYYEDTEEGKALLESEEQTYNDKVAAEEEKKLIRANRAKDIEEAYKNAVEAFEHYAELKDQFLKDYGSFHMTVKNPTKHFGSGLFDYVFDPFFKGL